MADSQQKINEPRDWAAYYAKVGRRPPRPTMLRSAEAFAREPGGEAGRLAVDLGCGIGRDALPLLRRGWRVLAIDAEPEATRQLREAAAAERLDGLETRTERFEEAGLPPCDLVNASFSLFGCPPDRFPDLWQRIVGALRPGGRFAGQLLGPHDSWAARRPVVALDRAALDSLLEGLEVEQLEEEETDAVTPRGEAKHWHIWHLNLCRPPS